MRIDMTTREWHELVKPVLPHILADAELPELANIRIEPARTAVIAVATDRYTLAAERHDLDSPLPYPTDDYRPAHIRATEVTASLKLFPYSKDYDPPLKITIDRVPFPVTIAGYQRTVDRYALTVESGDGTRLVMHDHRDPGRDPMVNWRRNLAAALARRMDHDAPALYLAPSQLARWAAACRKGERLSVFTGSEGDDLVLIAAGDHFLGAWKPVSYLDTPTTALAESPWHEELRTYELSFGQETGEPAGTEPPELGPWITADFDGTDCAGVCGNGIDPGDKIRSDGAGGWLCQYCGVDE